MKILITTLEGNISTVEVSPQLEIINLKALCETETHIPVNEMAVSHSGRPLNDDLKTLEFYNIKENDVIIVQKIVNNLPFIDFSSIRVPQSNRGASAAVGQNIDTARYFREMMLSDRSNFAVIQQRFPELANAIQLGNTTEMMRLLGQLTGGTNQLPRQNSLPVDLFDREIQERIAENIRLQNVQQNMESALEYMPEAFGHIVMLYINCYVNGHHVKAFVDSGAQMTLMSAACAERCGIMRLVDKRWAGIAKGVGTQKIVGRIHLAQLKIENSFLTTAFSILENQPMDMLLGLDILRRHQCIIDLQRNSLIIGSAKVETKFLPEAELPPFARLSSYESLDDEEFNETLKSSVHSSNPQIQQPSTSAQPRYRTYPESQIKELQALGFTRQEVIDALDSCDGDFNVTKVKLLAKSFQFPIGK